MTYFRPGDRVRVVGHQGEDLTAIVETGRLNAYGKIALTVEGDYHTRLIDRFPKQMTLIERSGRGPDPVNHPAHYTQYPVEVIEITEHLNFCRGNAVKYICRAGHKGDELEDLKKSLWYIKREIERLEKSNG